MTIGVPILMWVLTLLYGFTYSGYKILGHCKVSTIAGLLGNEPLCSGGNSSSDGAATDRAGVGAATVAYVRKQVGLPYVTGGPTNGSVSKPNNFDCSGLSRDGVLEASGGKINLVHHAATQFAQLAKHSVNKSNQSAWLPGDLIFYFIPGDLSTPGHVAIYIGGGKVIEAARPGVGVIESDVPQGPGTYIMGVRRPSEAYPAATGTPATAAEPGLLKAA